MPKKRPSSAAASKHAARAAISPANPPSPSAASIPAIAIVVSRYNESITDPLLIGAMEAYERAGGDSAALAVIHAPGAYELPVLALAAAESGRFSGVVALGCVIKGQTRHDRYISQAVARGLMDVSLHTRLPVSFGVLTVENVRQARERAGGPRGNKGAEAMRACLETLLSMRGLGVGPTPPWSLSASTESSALTPPPRPGQGALEEGPRVTLMATPRLIRRVAFQTLFQLDASAGRDVETIRESLTGVEELSAGERAKAMELASKAFEARAQADREIVALAPGWPTHRQPPVDRAILRLAHFEITAGRVLPAIAINEAVELAKDFGTDRSPAFVNAILDKIAKAHQAANPAPLPMSDPLSHGPADAQPASPATNESER